jgi:predicted AlkP superfamily phosphohydrolase/phosphomutase
MYDYIKETCGPTPPTANLYDHVEYIHQCMLDGWVVSCDWQSKAIHEIVEREGIEVVFSHMHIDDMVDHTFIHCLSPVVCGAMSAAGATEMTYEDYVRWQNDLYVATDNYLGTFLHYLDEGWTIIITSDHAQIASTYSNPGRIGSITGYNVRYFEEWGYTTMKRDENGERIPEVDWSKTKAIMNRSEDIYINLKGRQPEGIVDPADKYELEEEIMTKLYELKHPATGHRIVSLAVRNKDAVHFGLGGPECGDIIYFLAEPYNQHHGDSLSTAQGECNTSVSPIFVGAGPGFKQGFYTDRIIRQVDVAPTISALLGVRFPAQCEGSPAYQILDWEF